MPLFVPVLPVPAVVGKAWFAPAVTLSPARKVYTMGEPIPVSYRVLNATAIPMTPIRKCPVGVYDFRIELSVRRADGVSLAPMSHGMVNGARTKKGHWSPFAKPNVINVNDCVSIDRPGDYIVSARLVVMRPASGLRVLTSNTVIVRVVDTLQAREKRTQQIQYAARMVADQSAPPGKRQAAVEALRYFSDPEALPVLFDAANEEATGGMRWQIIRCTCGTTRARCTPPSWDGSKRTPANQNRSTYCGGRTC